MASGCPCGETSADGRAQRGPRRRVSEGASSRSVGELLSAPGGSPGPVAINAVITPATAVFSDSAPPPHLVDLVDEIAPRPMFLIYASKGTGGEEKRANRGFHRAAGAPRRSGRSPRPATSGASRRPREYEQRVTGFFDRSLRGGARIVSRR